MSLREHAACHPGRNAEKPLYLSEFAREFFSRLRATPNVRSFRCRTPDSRTDVRAPAQGWRVYSI